jgi:hypothetical protein
MVILVFKTSLNHQKHVQMISPILNSHPQVINWSVDLDDWERILRIEVKDRAAEYGIAECIKALGFDCEDLDH